MTTNTGEILTVNRVVKDSDGTWCVECPHCKKIIGLEAGPIRGEQFQHSGRIGCSGWFEVSHEAKAVLP